MKATQPMLFHLWGTLDPLPPTGWEVFMEQRVKTTLVSRGTRHIGKSVSSSLRQRACRNEK